MEELMKRTGRTQAILIAFVLMAFLAGSLIAGDGCPASKAKAEASSTKSTDTKSAQAGCAKTCGSKAAAACTPAEKKACGASLATSDKLGKLTLGVAYMTCNGCAGQVSTALKGVSGVQSVAVDYRTGTADVEYDAKFVTTGDLVSAVEKAGYHAQVGPYSEKELMEFAKGGKPEVSSVSATPTVKAVTATEKAGSE